MWVQKLFFCILASFVFAHSASADVTFPETRSAVGPGEVYELGSFGDWTAICERDEDGEDFCWVTTDLSDLENGLELYLDIFPIDFGDVTPPDADVHVLPHAIVEIAPYSSADHYSEYGAAITSIDGLVYDGYWCHLTQTDRCERGPEIELNAARSLLSGEIATVTVFGAADTPEQFNTVSNIDVSLEGLERAYIAAGEFTAAVYGLDGQDLVAREICTLEIEGEQRRITYTFDEDFDSRMTSWSEAVRGPAGEGNCPSYVVLAYLAPEATQSERELFCLLYDDDGGDLLGIGRGEQDARRACAKPSATFCERVNAGKNEAMAIASLTSGLVGGATGTASVTGTTVVMHSSGAAILTGPAGYVAGTLGTIGTSTLALLTAPVTVATAAVSVIAVGGAVYACWE